MEHNLHIYELVLLFLGALLFLILSGGLVFYIIKKQEIKKLLFFFPIPILMMAYPSIQEINISSDKIELSKYQQQYEENPEDNVAREKIEELTEELETRVSSEEDLVQITKSNILLGKPEKAIATANTIIEKNQEKINAPNSGSKIVSSSSLRKKEYLKKAYQLKRIAAIQQESIKEQDTTGISKKLNRLKLTPELTNVSSIVKKTVTRNTYQIKNKSID